MNPVKIHGFTRELGKPADWDESKNGPCDTLAVIDTKDHNNNPCMVSAWKPTPEELEALNRGMPVLLWVYGAGHPPVAVGVAITE